jgi:hypothetical protein
LRDLLAVNKSRRTASRAVQYKNRSCKKVTAMVDLMSLEEQVDREFAAARRRARMRRLRGLLRGKGENGTLRSFEATRRSVGAAGGVRRGRSTVETSRVVGSVGKHDRFDEGFMPLSSASSERWKRIDRAFRSGLELPPVTLYRLGEDYFVQDGHHRVSVYRFHGVEWLDAEVTEFRVPNGRLSALAGGYRPVAP